MNSASAAPAEGAADNADDSALRKRLLSRIAVAGVAIAGLLGGLAVYDSLNKPRPPAMPKMAAESVAPAAPAVPAVPAEAAAEKPAEEKAAVTAEDKVEESKTASAEPAPPVPERTATPLAPPAAEKPGKTAKPLTPPATARSAAVKPTPPAAAPVKPDAQREIARAMPERTAPTHAPASRPLTQAAETAQRYLLQVGVFSNHANAEELVARLQQAGIPAQIESRVQVGPFAPRAEADAARAKLKSLGIADGLLVRR